MNELMQNLLKLQALEFDQEITGADEKLVKALRAKIPPAILAHYDRLADCGKKGVALVHNQVCPRERKLRHFKRNERGFHAPYYSRHRPGS